MTKAGVCLFFALMTISFEINCYEGNSLLSAEDLELQRTDRQNPVLSVAFDGSDRQKTYSQWMCFEAEQVQFEGEEVRYAEKTKWLPLAIVTTLGQRFEFSLYDEFGEDGKEVLKKWKDLYAGAPEICFYAPFLQYVKKDREGLAYSQWLLQRMKTKNGYWIVNHKLDENYVRSAKTATLEVGDEN